MNEDEALMWSLFALAVSAPLLSQAEIPSTDGDTIRRAQLIATQSERHWVKSIWPSQDGKRMLVDSPDETSLWSVDKWTYKKLAQFDTVTKGSVLKSAWFSNGEAALYFINQKHNDEIMFCRIRNDAFEVSGYLKDGEHGIGQTTKCVGAMSRDGQRFATVDESLNLNVFSLAPAIRKTLTYQLSSDAQTIVFSPDCRKVLIVPVSQARAADAVVFDLKSERVENKLLIKQGDLAFVHRGAWAEDQSNILLLHRLRLGYQFEICVYSLSGATSKGFVSESTYPNKHNNNIRGCVDVVVDPKLDAVYSCDNGGVVWEYQLPSKSRRVLYKSAECISVALSPTTPHLLVGDKLGGITIVPLRRGSK